MKRLTFLSIIVSKFFSLNAQNINLPKPETEGGESVLKAIAIRQSDRSFKDGDISLQDLSTILWAGFGYSHDDKRTIPTAMNRQDIDLYVFLSNGIYKWNAKDNVLELIKKGDYRKDTDKPNGFASKVTNIAIVSDLEKFGVKQDHHRAFVFGAMSSAYAGENMYLAISGMNRNLGTVTRYAAQQEKEIATLLQLNQFQRVFLFQTIGYKK